MVVYTREKIKQLLKIDFVRFSIVGGSGFLINLIFLIGLSHVFHVPIFFAQLIGAEIALFSNFMLHNNWTYKHRKVQKTFISLLVQFHATSWPAIVGSTLMVSIGVHFLHLNKPLSLAISSVIALVWNFVWSKYVVWRDVSPEQVKEIT